MILQTTIDNVLALDIVEVISRYVELKKSGSNWKGLSPFTNERSPSFMVSPQKAIFKCFSSGKGGNVISFIIEKEHYNFPEAVKHLCQMFNVEYLETEMTSEEKILAQQKESLYIINQVANNYYKANLWHFKEAKDYVDINRQLDPHSISKFDLGFGPNTLSGLTNELINNGYNWQLAVQSSVLGYVADKNRLYDRFRNRIMFPIKNITGNIVGFGGRALQKDEKIPKYLNSSDSIIYNKSEVLYGIFESKKAITEKNKCLLCEGYMDVVMFHQKEVENIVASAGTSLTIEQVKLIKRFTKNVTIMFDSDNAGIRAALRGIDLLLAEGMNVKVVILPEGQDPDDFAKARTKDQIEDYILSNEKDFVIFKLNHLLKIAGEDIGLRTNAIVDVIATIAKIPCPIAREIYLQECSRMVDMGIDTARIMLKTTISEDADFSVVNIESFQEQSTLSKSFLQEQCEKKILQYVLAYGTQELEFKEVELYEEEFRGKVEFEERIVVNKRTVLNKVVFELDNDGIEFNNAMFHNIFQKAKTIDLSDINLLQHILDAESFLLAQNLRNEEWAMHQSSFTNENIIGKEIVNAELYLALEKSINECLLFYKSIYIEKLIDELTKAEQPNVEEISMLVELMIKIKRELNLI